MKFGRIVSWSCVIWCSEELVFQIMKSLADNPHFWICILLNLKLDFWQKVYNDFMTRQYSEICTVMFISAVNAFATTPKKIMKNHIHAHFTGVIAKGTCQLWKVVATSITYYTDFFPFLFNLEKLLYRQQKGGTCYEFYSSFSLFINFVGCGNELSCISSCIFLNWAYVMSPWYSMGHVSSSLNVHHFCLLDLWRWILLR